MAAVRARLVIDQSQMRAVLTGPESAAFRLVDRAVRQTLAQAKINTPVDTGQLRNSHKAQPVRIQGSKITATIEASGSAQQEYALAVHEGSRPHVIRPRRKKVLSWKGPEGRVFASEVHHPGAKARPWLLSSTRQVATRLGFEVTRERT